jgi:hypothetical protein
MSGQRTNDSGLYAAVTHSLIRSPRVHSLLEKSGRGNAAALS